MSAVLVAKSLFLLLPQKAVDDAARTAGRIREVVSTTTFRYTEGLTVSAGVATLADCGNHDAMLRRADEALYEAKGAGRNVVIVAAAETFRLYSGARQ